MRRKRPQVSHHRLSIVFTHAELRHWRPQICTCLPNPCSQQADHLFVACRRSTRNPRSFQRPVRIRVRRQQPQRSAIEPSPSVDLIRIIPRSVTHPAHCHSVHNVLPASDLPLIRTRTTLLLRGLGQGDHCTEPKNAHSRHKTLPTVQTRLVFTHFTTDALDVKFRFRVDAQKHSATCYSSHSSSKKQAKSRPFRAKSSQGCGVYCE